ncbi:hypothetical protein CEXT_124471 [Caerostris extrusa]|uniref:Uncharacterized protein n=1 Tax=Caerostris extrusa TaxID=172846 RepID=A0AAV4NB73_CAEEX|nr:hypothetical protein CEXT_124471 [Caerostris extrusa]
MSKTTTCPHTEPVNHLFSCSVICRVSSKIFFFSKFLFTHESVIYTSKSVADCFACNKSVADLRCLHKSVADCGACNKSADCGAYNKSVADCGAYNKSVADCGACNKSVADCKLAINM